MWNMDHELNRRDDMESLRDEVTELGRSLRSSFRVHVSSFRSSTSSAGGLIDEETALQWAAIERLPTFTRLRSSLFDESKGNEGKRKRVIDVTKLGALERRLFIDNLIKHIEDDNLRLLRKIKKRFDKVGIKLPTVEVRYDNLHVEAECQVVDGKPLPTLWNSLKMIFLDVVRLPGLKSEMSKIHIIDGVSGIIKPGRMTLLLGPPGSGKTSLLKALSGNLDKYLKTAGEVCYNGYRLKEFVPQKTCAYISQYDLHIPEMTVRETLDFSSYCQGVGGKEEIMAELSRREKLAGILPDPDIDTYMKAISVEGRKAKLQTDYITKILGLDICADTLVGDANRRGISGGQKKRLTTGEMIVGPMKTLFMDEISNGLDSSTTHQIVSCLQHLAHITDATIFVSLLQPAPEVFDLFDDIVLLAEGKIVYHGPRENILEFFESCRFKCPERKGIADFLQEVISEKDQAQYWYDSKDTYIYHSVKMFSTKFNESVYGKKLKEQISVPPLAKSRDHKDAISFRAYSLPRWSMLKACFAREFLLMKRSSFVYVFKTTQLFILASITMTVFLRTRMDRIDLIHADYYMGALFYSLVIFILDGLPEAALTVGRLAGFYKQRDLKFYPSWAYAIPSITLKIPLSMLAAFIWTSLTYFVIGYTPDISRFFRHLILLFSVHFTSMSMFRFLGSVSRTLVSASASTNLALICCFVFGGFVIPRPSMPIWLRWGFWVSPLTYGEIGLAVNEFYSSRWQKMLPSNITVGRETLESHGLNFDGYTLWIALGALFSLAALFNLGYVLALSFLRPPASHAIISREKLSQMNKHNESNESKKENTTKGRMQLHFEPLTVAFQDLQYYIETPSAMKERGFAHKKLQLLQDITGTFRPGVLTALMGVSGAGKTTLFDVLAGRKTIGTIEGEIKIGGYPKVQKTYARSSGYCEQSDIHSPNITVEESLMFSAWLRLHPSIDIETRTNFVKEVLETVELEAIKDSMVGIPGVSGLSTEERKRLTVAVELVANPSIIFLDEPTTGLDARAAAIVMRAIKRVADTGRTIVCTIHQPSIDIFESFDEIILLKSGGRMIYNGPLGPHSSRIIEYFESISGVQKIRKNFNPATWVLEVTSTSMESDLGVDFAEIYKNSTLYQHIKEVAKTYSSPTSESKALGFSSTYSQNGWGQFKACLWKQYWSYWRSPLYNLRRIMFTFLLSLLLAGLFSNQGRKVHNQQSLFNTIGSMYTAIIFCGINNTLSVMPYVSTERQVFYRERFSGMYSIWAYALAQAVTEIPYVFIQTVVFTCVTYPMIGYHLSAFKIFFYFYTVFCTLLYNTHLGMMIVSITPNYQVAAILPSCIYSMFHLFSGYLVPPQHIPKWWIWLYYLVPTSWSLRGLATSQYGDIHDEIEFFGETKTVALFLRDYFGFHHNQLPLIAVILFLFPISFATVYGYCLGNLKFQRR